MLDDLRLIDSIGINERTIVSWFDKVDKSFNFGIFHLTDQPNYISKLSGLTEYGYLTYVGYPLEDHNEAAEVYMLYLNDLLGYNNWWENDENLVISDGAKQQLEDKFGSVDKSKESDTIEKVTRRFTLIQGDIQ